MRVVGFGTYDVLRHPRVGVVLAGLHERGVDIVEVNIPLGFSTADRVNMLSRPGTALPFVLRLLACWLRLAWASVPERRRGVDVVIVGYLGHFDVLVARLLFPGSTIVLDLLIFAADTARDRGTTNRWGLALLEWLDRLAVRTADLVLVDTAEQLELLAPMGRQKGLVLPVGAESKWFVPRSWDSGEQLSVVFYGLFTPLQGAPTIGAAIAQLAGRKDVRFTIIGNGQDYEATREVASASTRVTWRTWVAPDELPNLVAQHDVCLGIFGTTSKALRVTPNKVYQGAAAGCAIITSDTAPQRRALGAAGRYVAVGDADALAAAIAALADDRATAEQLGRAARARAEEAFTSMAITQPLIRKLGKTRLPHSGLA